MLTKNVESCIKGVFKSIPRSITINMAESSVPIKVEHPFVWFPVDEVVNDDLLEPRGSVVFSN